MLARVATSATALVAEAETSAAADEVGEPAIDLPEEVGSDTTTAPFRRRPARTGAAIGTAVHRVLELVSFTAASDGEVRRLAEVACAEQEIPALVADVIAQVQNALAATIVREAAGRGRYWREVYVISRSGERYVEGYIDLLTEDAGGDLIVVDYKTDRVPSETDQLAKQRRYAPQLAAYAEAVSSATGLLVSGRRLVFARPKPSLKGEF